MIKPRQAAATSIENIINKKSFSNIESASWLNSNNWAAEDQRLYIRILYGTLENLLLIDKIIETMSNRKISKIDTTTCGVIRISIYQLIFTDRIPAYAVINEAVEITKKHKPKAAGFVNAVLRNVLREYQKHSNKEEFLERYISGSLSLRYSHTDWIINKLQKNYSQKQVADILKYHQEPPTLTIRLNLLKGDVEYLINQLNSEGIFIKHIPWMKESYLIGKSDKLLTSTTSYKIGLFHIQSIASMLAVHWMDPQPNELIVDVAAAPGGKTTHICQRMHNQGKIVARDISVSRSKQIQEHAHRLSCDIIDTYVADGTEHDMNLDRIADRVLVDAPCSSMGMIRKKPELKLIHKQHDFVSLPLLQERILENASYMVKPGGVLLYSTCTYFSEENTSVVSSFLSKHPEFQLMQLNIDQNLSELRAGMSQDGMIQLGPHINPLLDGFFVAKLGRKQD